MSENAIVILNSVSILFLLAFVSYASYRAEELSNAIWGFLFKKQPVSRIGYFKYDFVWYAIIIIVLTIGVIQISQLNVGIPKIRPDGSFIVNIFLWPSLLMAFMCTSKQRKK